jgi:hypothetical protein
MRRRAETALMAVALGLGLCIAGPAVAGSTSPILHANSIGGSHIGAGIRGYHWQHHNLRSYPPDLGLYNNYQPYYSQHSQQGENYGHYQLAPFDYPSIVPQYSR